MPSIKIPKSQFLAAEQKRGIYSKLKEEIKPKTSITLVIKETFIEYARAHSCPPDKIEIEWNRFYKFLKDKL